VCTPAEIEVAIVATAQRRVAGLVVSPEPLFDTHRQAVVDLASRKALPAIYGFREYVAQGGLMSYGPSLTGGYRQAGDYVGRILRGATPAELPIVQPKSFELALNTTSARALGIEWPRTLLLRADEVLE
jgi:putative ABC transport system substrate-binding protein